MENYVFNTVNTLNRKVSKVNKVIKEALLLSSKTYFFDEVNKLNKENEKQRKKIDLLQAKNFIFQRKLEGADFKELNKLAAKVVQNSGQQTMKHTKAQPEELVSP